MLEAAKLPLRSGPAPGYSIAALRGHAGHQSWASSQWRSLRRRKNTAPQKRRAAPFLGVRLKSEEGSKPCDRTAVLSYPLMTTMSKALYYYLVSILVEA